MNANIRNIFFGVVLASLTSVPSFADEQPEVEALDLRPGDASDVCVPGSLQIRATVNGVTQMGLMKLELYNSDDGFLSKSGRMRSVRVAATDAPMMMCIDVPEAGTYAIAGYHDKDGNRKLKKKWDFTPREPYGLSNNPEIKKRRIPKWREVSFEVPETGADITINLVDLKKKKDDD